MWTLFTMLLPSACSQGARGNDGQPGPAGPPVSLFPSPQVYSRGPVESAVFAQCKRSSALTSTGKEEE